MAARLLITARDVAAALHLVQVASAAQVDARFDVSIAAQEPAARHFAAAGLPVTVVAPMAATSADAPEAARLRSIARELLARVRPDAVLAGLSTPFDAGLDEAVLAETTVPSLLYQDFWGEQNLVLGRGAGRILAIDEQAAARNQSRYGIASTVVGSARHAAYAQLDIPEVRARNRAAMGLAAHQRLVGFFGQALHHLPGYQRTVERFVDAFRHADPSTVLVVRSHPREELAQRRQTEQYFRAVPGLIQNGPEGPVEDLIAACDVVVSLFSICTFDAAYLNRFSKQPVAVPVSMLFDDEIASYCRQHGNYFDFTHHTLGLVVPVYDAAMLTATLRSALAPATRAEVWANAHKHLPDPAEAPARVLTAVHEEVSRS